MTENVTEMKTIQSEIVVGKKIICDCCEKVIAEKKKRILTMGYRPIILV